MVSAGCAASSAISGSSCHGRAWLSRIAGPDNRTHGRQWPSVGRGDRRDAGVEAQGDPVADRLAGQAADEAPVAHHQQAVPVARGDLGLAEAAAAPGQRVLALLDIGPPALRQVAEGEAGPAAHEIAAVAADVADEAVALAHLRLDGDREVEDFGDDLGGVQRAPVGAGDDAADAAGGQALAGLARLALALLGELRVDDARIDAGLGEVHVEVRLAVAHEDHGPILPRSCGGLRSSSVTSSYSPSITPPPRRSRPVTSTPPTKTRASPRAALAATWRAISRRSSRRNGGKNSSRPRASVTKPGTSSSAPASTRHRPSNSSRAGSSPWSIWARARIRAVKP